MSKWIEVEPLMDKAKEYGGYYEDTVYAVPLADISEAPSIDLVRCAECKWFRRFDEGWNACEKHMIFMQPDDFCSYGDKRDD